MDFKNACMLNRDDVLTKCLILPISHQITETVDNTARLNVFSLQLRLFFEARERGGGYLVASKLGEKFLSRW
jgi:hypothetical protein